MGVCDIPPVSATRRLSFSMPIFDCDRVPTFAESIIADNRCSSFWYDKADPVRAEMF
jgi:hypothetical protein